MGQQRKHVPQQKKIDASAPKARQGAKPDPTDKPPWACRPCYAAFVEQGTLHRYHFIPGSQLECRCGEHKGSCFLGTKDNAAEKFEAKQAWLRGDGSQQGNDGKPAGGGRQAPSKRMSEVERLREELRVRKISSWDA